jgi:4-alpha-glucanotransferase
MDETLAELARAHGVATRYENWQRHRVEVAPEVIVAVLGVLGVVADRPAAVRDALAEVRARRQARAVPPTLVVRQGQQPPAVPDGELFCPDGTGRPVRGRLPTDLTPGWYRLVTTGSPGSGQQSTVIVSPPRLPEPPLAWGWQLQLYSMRSRSSWGLGDFADLATFVQWAGADTGAGVVLLNPLHAVVPRRPVPASPYSPSSRRFINPIYLRVEQTAAYRRADAALRSRVDALRPADGGGDLIDYDLVWQAKQAALELLWAQEPPVDVDADPALRDYATYCALAERYGAGWQGWPGQLHRPEAPAVARARTELAPRIAFHAWLQRQCDEQLGAAAQASTGMSVGIVHDLAVGIDAGGADAWMLQDVIAQGVSVGAPPDAFNQRGQDWGLATWRPDRLATTGYQAIRELLAAALRHGSGLRVDHVAGLWRLWWIPPGASPDQGTYVHYDGEAMLAALAVEGQRAGAVVIGEDLGTVRPEVTEGLHERNMLSSAVLWFARDDKRPGQPFLPPPRWPRLALASVSTHDLPTAMGFLTGEHVRVRAELGVLARSETDERAQAEEDRRRLLDLLHSESLTTAEASNEELVTAMHALLARTPCRLVLASPYDVLGEVRQPNLPGTVDEYPNWRIPLPLTLEELIHDDRARAVVDMLARTRPPVASYDGTDRLS